MSEYSPKKTAAMKARVKRLRAHYRRLLTASIIIFFILGVVAGIWAYRWYLSRTPDAAKVNPAATSEATGAEVTLAPEATPEAWAMSGDEQDLDEDIFPQDEDDQADTGAELDAFPEVDSNEMTEDGAEADANQNSGTGLLIAPGEKLVPQPEGEEQDEGTPEETEAPAEDAGSNDGETAEATPAPDGENPEETAEAEPADEGGEAEQQKSGYGPQVVAIVPYGESFTYTTEINSQGNARVEVTDEPYETVCFTQTMRNYMRPADYAAKYSTQYKLVGDEAGASFELVLNDYTGKTTIIPQNVVDVSLCSESGDTVEHGYQLMDAEIDGKYGIALPTNTPKTFYKRYAYSADGEEMKYLVITTYKNGETQMILFELENPKPETEEEVIYPVLQRGLANDDVLNLQNRLMELGYLTGPADGTFGQKTEDAIKSAQAAFGMEPTGIADNAFQQKLYEGAAPSVGNGLGYVTLTEGSSGDAVVRLQKRLAELGYYSGKADGGYGPMMISAVKKAQVDFGMEQTGIADSAFQQRAFADGATGEFDTGYTVLQKGSKGDTVVRLQLALREQGFYNGKADGGYGPMMVTAVKKAQAAFGMEQTGVADVAFQQRLFGTVTVPTEEPEADAGATEEAAAGATGEAAADTVG